MDGTTATELASFLAPPILLSLGLSLITAQLLIGWVLWSLPTPLGSRSKIRKFGRILIEDSFVNAFVLSIFSVPNLAMRLIGEFGWGSADAAYENLYEFLGLGCCSPGNTSPACLSNCFGETINRQGLCGVPTGAGLLGAALAGYRYAFWDIITWLFIFFVIVVAITIAKGIVPYALQTIADFAGGIITNFSSNYLATLMLLLIPIFVMIPALVYMIYVLYFLSKFIQVVWPALLLLGGFLYGLPARLGRKWGAVLIAVTLVFYIGLPIMPAFVNTMASTQNAQTLLADMQTDYNKVLSLVEQYGGTDIIFQVQPRQFGPGGAPYMAAPDFARIQISGGGAPDRYIWTDGHGLRGYFLPPGTYTIPAVWWHGVPVTFNGTQTSFTITEDDIKASKESIKHTTLTADVYSFRFTMASNNGTIFFPVGFRMWGDAWSNVRVYSMQLDEQGVGFTFYVDSSLIAYYQFFMFAQQNVAFTDLLDGASPFRTELSNPHFQTLFTDGAVYWYRGIVVGLHGGYHTFKVTVNSIGPAPVPLKQDEDSYSLSNLQNPMLPKPNGQRMADLGQYYASILILPNIFVYIILVGFSAGLARMLKGRSII